MCEEITVGINYSFLKIHFLICRLGAEQVILQTYFYAHHYTSDTHKFCQES